MKIAIIRDAFLPEVSMVFLREIKRHFPLAEEIHFPIDLEESAKTQLGAIKQKIYGVVLRSDFLARKIIPHLVEKIDFGNFDIVFSFSNGFAHGIISPSSTIHVNFTSSRNFQKLNSGIFTDVKFRQWDFFAAQRADFHIADCVFTQSEIKKVYKRDSILIYPKQETIEKIAVSNGADFFLTISDDQANYDGLRKTIEIFNKTARRLVVFTDWRQKKNLELICGETIDLVDDFTQEMFYEFLANCRAFLLPDDFDFLLAARAAAYGKPLVAHDQGAAAEFVISNVNGELFFEKSMREIENAIGRLLAKKNVYSSAKIESYAQEFLKKNAVKPLAKFLKSLEK